MTQRERVLAMLEDAGSRGVTSGEFYGSYLPRFSARILELRKAGHNITSERIRDGAWRYTLGGTAGGRRGAESPPPGHLFTLPDAYDELRHKDAA